MVDGNAKLYDSPFDKYCPILAMKSLLEEKEKDEPNYFKDIVTCLNQNELEDLKRCFQYAEEAQKRDL